MDVKGQVSAEYLLLALVFLIIIGSVTVPLVGSSISSSLDISSTSDVSAAINSITNAVGVVYANGPGAKRTVNVYFPIPGTLNYASNAIQMQVPLQSGGNKLISSNVPIAVTITGGTVGKGNYNAQVAWASGTSPITVTLTTT
ncbi:hypothetical protein [Methanobacterium sp. SMA-27]|uniref:hypothetical protein n=1 Tax=Methanobacterium sp. SMA-27 TaxID=1495336 RepID=UPI00064FE554|nr:hypothetical protein [Methanobacterium sp. SMA-27]